ncbi:MAG: glycosyltransferase family 39 protein [bacterium]|nr:glycosyltransferase family 39 protein [bacterium]
MPLFRAPYFIAYILFVLTVLLRLHGITTLEPQPDEVHWHGRAFQIVESLRTGVYSYATSHLGHPGIFPAGLMGLGEWLGDHVNMQRGLVEGDPGYLYHLYSARIAVIVFSSIAVPILFLFLYIETDLLTALLASVLLLSFPAHSFVSRMAHLDGSLTVLVMLTAMFYRRAVLSRKVQYFLMSGLCFSMAVATKPTSLGLIPALYLWSRFVADRDAPIVSKTKTSRMIRLLPRREEIWILIFAQLLFAGVFTRFWSHRSIYFREIVPDLPLADLVYKLFSHIHASGVTGACVMICLLLTGMYFYNWPNCERKSTCIRLAHAIWMFVVIFSAGGLWPAIPENICRYWVRVFMLPGVAHESYGEVINSGHLGYLTLLATETPLLIVIGLIFGLTIFLHKIVCHQRVPEWLVFSIFVPLCWIVMMSSSGKQTIRYIMPVIPFLISIGAFGIVGLARLISGRWFELFYNQSQQGDANHKGTFFSVISRFVISKQLPGVLCVLFLLPHLYFSPVFKNGLRHGRYLNFLAANSLLSVQKNRTSAFVDVDKAILWLHQRAIREGRELWVNVAGDVSVASLNYDLLEKKTPLLRFRSSPWATGAEYLLVFSGFHERLEPEFARELFYASRVYDNYYNGHLTSAVYRLARPNKLHPIDLEAYSAQRGTGAEVELSENLKVGDRAVHRLVRARTGHDKQGLLWFGQFVPTDPGKIRAEFYIRPYREIKATLDNTLPAVKVSLSRSCHRLVNIAELSDFDRPVILECENSEFKVYNVQVTWLGQVSLDIAMVRLSAD